MPTLLLVDDDLEILRALASGLGPLGEVIAAADGASALETLRSVPIDLLVCDLRLPDASGIDIISEGRSIQPDLCALLLTGRAQLPDLAEAINRAGVYRYLPKPIDLDDLLVTARSALESQELKRERERLHAELERSAAALRTLYEASRELSQSPGRGEIALAALGHLARAVPFALGGMLVAPPNSQRPALYLQAAMPVDEATLTAFKERIVAEHASRTRSPLQEHEVRLILLGPQIAPSRELPKRLHLVDVALDAGGANLGTVQLLCAGAPTVDERRLVGVLASEAAQALRRVEVLTDAHERELDLLLRSLADGIVVLGGERAVTLVNPAARALLGLGPNADGAEVVATLGFEPYDLVRGWEQSGPHAVKREVATASKTLHVLASPVLEATGQVCGVALVLRDLTAEKELDRRKEEFVSIVSHEMRTPLASISGSLELLMRGYVGDLSDKQKHYLGLAKDGCARLHGVVDDLLDLAKYERGELDVRPELVDLGGLLRDAVEQYHGAAFERGVVLECQAPEGALVMADPPRFFQVLNNILSNALKFTLDRGRVEIALLSSEIVRDFVGFTIWNSGPTVADEDLEQMFEKFRQLPGARRRIGGTGLGLPIARGLIETHGGRLWAKTGLSDGVRFIAALPRSEAGAAGPGLPIEGGEAASARVPGTDAGGVLVAHRDRAAAWLAKGAFLRSGMEAHTAEDPDGLLAIARRRHPCAAVIECALLGEEGDLLKLFAHDPDLRDVALVLLGTPAWPVPGTAVVLEPPTRAADLVAGVDRALELRTQGRRLRVVICEPDPAARASFAEALIRDGLEVEAVGTGADAIQSARGEPPDLVIADMGDDESGFDLARALGAGRSAGPALLMTGRAGTLAQKVRAFREGAADFLVKPVDAGLVRERARTALARRREDEATPTTGLPGLQAIERELRRRISRRIPYACLQVSVEHLELYARAYGFAKAEAVVRQLGALVREVLFTFGAPNDFGGHVEREHFVVVTAPSRADSIGEELSRALRRLLPLYYDHIDRTKPGVSLMTPTIVAVIDEGGRFVEPSEIVTAAQNLRRRVGAAGYLREDPGGSSRGDLDSAPRVRGP